MSRIQDLRDSEKNKINFIHILETFMDDTKYIIMYQKLFKDMIQENFSVIKIKETIVNIFPEIDQDKLNKLNDLEILFAFYMFTAMMPVEINKDFQLFCKYNEKKAIKRNDLQSYHSFNEIRQEIADIKEREKEKELEKQVIKVYDEGDWLIIRPLTYEASLKYGANTKWCTASKDEKQYFGQYTKNGALIYILNRKTNIKYAIHNKIRNKDITFWNVADNQISFFDIDIPADAIVAVRENVKIEKTNHELAKDILGNDNKPIKKPNGGYKSKTELLEQVQKQYERNARWAEYIEAKKSGFNYVDVIKASKRRY